MNISLFQNFLSRWLSLFASDPMIQLMQIGMLAVGGIIICIIFFTLRDVLIRSNSFLFMVFSLLLVTVFPILGLLFYLLIRPSRTLAECRQEKLLLEIKHAIEVLEKKLTTTKSPRVLRKKVGVTKK